MAGRAANGARELPMATALKENRPLRGIEAVGERPDGTRFSFLCYPTPIRDGSGIVTGGVNMLLDVTDRKTADSLRKDIVYDLDENTGTWDDIDKAKRPS